MSRGRGYVVRPHQSSRFQPGGRQTLAAARLRQISIAAAATAITEIVITPPSRLLVEALVGAGRTSFDPESIGTMLRAGVSVPLGLAWVDEGSGTDDPVGTAAVVA